MKRENLKKLSICCALLCLGLALPAVAQQKSQSPAGGKLAVEDAVLMRITAAVEAIDLNQREVTLKGPLGNVVTFIVDKKIKRLNEVKVGDAVTADYYVAIAAELRKPTAEEEKNPMVIVEAEGKSSLGTSAAGGLGRRIKAVTTVEGLDRPTQTITVKGPLGRYVTARVADPSWLTQTRIGETIVVTYTEALAISLEKAAGKAKK